MSYADEHRFAAPRRSGQSERKVEVADGSKVETVTHWDGRLDAIVTPATVRYGARVHRTGVKTGTTAEIRELTPKEARERYGDSR